jgi:hypothetical protein
MRSQSNAAQKALQRAMDEDRRYSRRHPTRNHWVRRMHLGEMPIEAPVLSTPDGRWFTAVRQIGPGLRVRAFFEQDKHFDTDLTEAQAQWVFNHVSGVAA